MRSGLVGLLILLLLVLLVGLFLLLTLWIDEVFFGVVPEFIELSSDESQEQRDDHTRRNEVQESWLSSLNTVEVINQKSYLEVMHNSHGDYQSNHVSEDYRSKVEARLGLFGLLLADVVIESVEKSNEDTRDDNISQTKHTVFVGI